MKKRSPALQPKLMANSDPASKKGRMAMKKDRTAFVAGIVVANECARNDFVPVRPPPAYAPPPATAPEPEPAEKQEKGEKGEKQEPEKGEKHEKQGIGLLGPVIGGIVLIMLGIMGYLSIAHPSIQSMLWAYFLVIIGIVVLIAAIYGAMMASKRHPPA